MPKEPRTKTGRLTLRTMHDLGWSDSAGALVAILAIEAEAANVNGDAK